MTPETPIFRRPQGFRRGGGSRKSSGGRGGGGQIKTPRVLINQFSTPSTAISVLEPIAKENTSNNDKEEASENLDNESIMGA
jgi:hypothetical protein